MLINLFSNDLILSLKNCCFYDYIRVDAFTFFKVKVKVNYFT